MNSPEYERVREKIARAICCFSGDNNSCAECEYNTPATPFPDCFCDIREKTDKILAIPELQIKKDVQELPENKGYRKVEQGLIYLAQQDMLKAGYIQVVKK